MVTRGMALVCGAAIGISVVLAMGFGDRFLQAQGTSPASAAAKAKNFEFRTLTHGIDYQFSELYRVNVATGATVYRDWNKKESKNVFKPVTDSAEPGPGDYDLILLNLDKGGYASYRIDRASGRCWLAGDDNKWTAVENPK